ncbi:MAG TPA: hypothetical protein VKQ72_19715, partial [Aggregatilineales bacterium]|nr:hypothetical protein [Aggregatilineales bacterium]
RDFDFALKEHWYRIPQARAPRSVDAEYVAFYFSRAFTERNGGIHFYARRTGHELVRRSDLLPGESQHRRANDLYFKLQLDELHEKVPPILNPTARPIAFIYTTWDRFISAREIADLYSRADWFVERVIHVLKQIGIPSEHRWQDEDARQRIAQLRIECQQGILMATTGVSEGGAISLVPGDSEADVNSSVEAIRAAVAALGGPLFVSIPPES